MSISPEFKENVQSNNVIRVRSALLDYLIIDRTTFDLFDTALDYANKSLEVTEEHDNKPFENEPEKWDKDYLNKQKASLMVNFSEKRIAHLKKVVTKVLPPQKQDVELKQSSHPNARTSKKKDTGGFDACTALIFAGVTVTTVGVIVSKPIVIGAGVVIVGVGGTIKVYKSRK